MGIMAGHQGIRGGRAGRHRGIPGADRRLIMGSRSTWWWVHLLDLSRRIAFVILIIVLLISPAGLLGRNVARKV